MNVEPTNAISRAARRVAMGARRSGAAFAAKLIVALASTFIVPAASAVTVKIDYTYDTSAFFANNTLAFNALESAASFYSTLLTDTFSSIQTPPNYPSQVFNGVQFWEWSLNFDHPATGGLVTLTNETIPANEYRIYAGARNIGPLGIGGPGGYNLFSDYTGNGFTQAEIDEIEAINDAFEDDVVRREETSGFARWGGAITFDTVGTTWHYNHTTSPPAGSNDFYSVAIHELGHALGFGTSSEWIDLTSGGFFIGANAASEFGGNNPPANGGHWASGTMSKVYGTTTPQEAAMDPEITTGTRKFFTRLDAAAFKDIGWELTLNPVTFNPADFNDSGSVNAADLTLWRAAFGSTAVGDADGDNDSDGQDFLIWQRNLGATSIAAIPEPATFSLAALVALIAVHSKRRRSLAAVRC